MGIRLGAIAEIMRINEKGEFILDNKGAVILNCGEMPGIKTLEEDSIREQGINIKNNNGVVNPQFSQEIKYDEVKENEIDEEESIDEKSVDDGADDLII